MPDPLTAAQAEEILDEIAASIALGLSGVASSLQRALPISYKDKPHFAASCSHVVDTSKSRKPSRSMPRVSARYFASAAPSIDKIRSRSSLRNGCFACGHDIHTR